MAIPHPIASTVLTIDEKTIEPDQQLGRGVGITLDGHQPLSTTGILIADPKPEPEGLITEENVARAAASQRDPGEIK